MGITDQMQLAAEHARQIIADIATHEDVQERLALLRPYKFAFEREVGTLEVMLQMRDYYTKQVERDSVPRVRPKLSLIRGGL